MYLIESIPDLCLIIYFATLLFETKRQKCIRMGIVIFKILLFCPILSWERAALLAALCAVISCAFVTFQCGLPGHVWYLILSIPDLAFLSTFINY